MVDKKNLVDFKKEKQIKQIEYFRLKDKELDIFLKSGNNKN